MLLPYYNQSTVRPCVSTRYRISFLESLFDPIPRRQPSRTDSLGRLIDREKSVTKRKCEKGTTTTKTTANTTCLANRNKALRSGLHLVVALVNKIQLRVDLELPLPVDSVLPPLLALSVRYYNATFSVIFLEWRSSSQCCVASLLGTFGSGAPAPAFGSGGGFGTPAPASGFGGGGITFGSAPPAPTFGK